MTPMIRTRRRPHLSLPLAAAALALPAASSPASAAVFTVPSPYATIQSAVDACAPGDTVLVAPGLYTGPGNRDIDFGGVDLVLLSESGANATILDVDGAPAAPHRALDLHLGETRNAVIDGFTIRGGLVRFSGGGGIRCDGASPTIRACIFEECLVPDPGEDGGAILLRNSSALVQTCEVRGNQAAYGGGIACRGATTAEISDCEITGNTAEHGGGIDAGGVGGPLILRCRIAGNLAFGALSGPSSGGGLVLGGTARVEDCVVSGNRSSFGGGVACWSGAPRIEGTTVAGNDAGDGGGGGIAARDGQAGLDRCAVWGNCASSGRGLLAGAGALAEVSCSILDFMEAQGGSIQETGPNLQEDPLFCDPADCLLAPTASGDYRVDASSPCRPQGNPCAIWIGGEVVGCPASHSPESLPGERPDSPAARPALQLHPPYPNPAGGEVRCAFDLDTGGRVRLHAFDTMGRRVELILDQVLPPGRHEAVWSRPAGPVRAGRYYLRLEADGAVRTRGVTLLERSPE